MTEIRGHKVGQGPSLPPVGGPSEPESGRKPYEAAGQAESPDSMTFAYAGPRAELADISTSVLAVQRSAGAVRKALATLEEIDAAMVFALDAAQEATAARSLPGRVVDALQFQLDLAINCIDAAASRASFGESLLFDGAFSLDAGDRQAALPRVSTLDLGSAGTPGMDSWGAHETSVQYSQSIASAASGGPNSLADCADGAARAFAAGLARVREIRQALTAFHEEAIVPRARELAVTLANTVASGSGTGSIDEATKVLSAVRRELQRSSSETAGVDRADSVLRLLE